LHVDGASGGFVWPFLYPDSEWDLRLEQVRSINVSGHMFRAGLPGHRLADLSHPGIQGLDLEVRAQVMVHVQRIKRHGCDAACQVTPEGGIVAGCQPEPVIGCCDGSVLTELAVGPGLGREK
jgi:hypothetical protein